MENSTETVPIYLDYCSTTPVDERVVEAMMPFFGRGFGNPANIHHAFGRFAADAVEEARVHVAALAECSPSDVIWTSGATEANNLALKGAHQPLAPSLRVVTQASEHPSVLEPSLSVPGTVILPVNSEGQIEINRLHSILTGNNYLVSVMAANNETGVIQPLEEIAKICRSKGALLHSDATQLFGKVRLPTNQYDMLSVSSHKLYGAKGAGALIVRNRRRDFRLRPLLEGGGQERGFRSGTLNVPAIVGFGEACRIANNEMKNESERLVRLRDTLEDQLLYKLSGVKINGSGSPRLPNISSVSFSGIDSESLILAMSRIAISSGSACSSHSLAPSHVMIAMGLDEDLQRGTVRISMGRQTIDQHILIAVDEISSTVTQLRQLSEHW